MPTFDSFLVKRKLKIPLQRKNITLFSIQWMLLSKIVKLLHRNFCFASKPRLTASRTQFFRMWTLIYLYYIMVWTLFQSLNTKKFYNCQLFGLFCLVVDVTALIWFDGWFESLLLFSKQKTRICSFWSKNICCNWNLSHKWGTRQNDLNFNKTRYVILIFQLGFSGSHSQVPSCSFWISRPSLSSFMVGKY